MENRLRCFNLGTDDFLPKPFEFRELSVRIRAILRRAGKRHREEAEPRVQVEGLNLDPETYEVSWRGQSVRLTPTEFRILYLLATNAGHVVPASRLYTYVWGSEGGDANALRSHISHIRRKLEIDGSGPGKITSVPAVGYVLRPDASSVPASAAPAARAPAPESTPLPIARPSLPAARLAPATVMLATSEATASSD
ncbi:MAG: response regulator transcription factor [Chloroflexi bacterium]|nr:MAG: response regulator transcription factor [Chloroflexota bacterium]